MAHERPNSDRQWICIDFSENRRHYSEPDLYRMLRWCRRPIIPGEFSYTWSLKSKRDIRFYFSDEEAGMDFLVEFA